MPILKEPGPADVITNNTVLSWDAPEFYDKHKKKVATLEWYTEHRPDFITALDAASGQTSSVGYHAMGVALRGPVLHHGWQQSSALAFVCKIMARSSSPVAALANLIIKAYLELTDPETAQIVVSCQEELDKDSATAHLDDIGKLAPAEPLYRYLALGMVRLDHAVTLACQEHWPDLWLCLAAVCCSRTADLDAFKKQRAGWHIRGDPSHYLARRPGTGLFPALSSRLGVADCMTNRLDQIHNGIACLCDSKAMATSINKYFRERSRDGKGVQRHLITYNYEGAMEALTGPSPTH